MKLNLLTCAGVGLLSLWGIPCSAQTGGDVQVSEGATLGGNGAVGGAVTVNGDFAPGPSEASLFAGNPVIPGWTADPEGTIFGNRYWIYPTYSAPYDQQVHFNAYSSTDLVKWQVHPRVLETKNISWATRALWAPSIIEKDGKYYIFFSANDIQSDSETGGIGVAVADQPEGPFMDLLGAPLVGKYYNGAQPIDAFVYHDDDGSYYLFYGGHSHCNIAKLKDDFSGFQLMTGRRSLFVEITPTDYVEGPFVFKRNGKYYFMWSEGGWTGPDYRVAYAMSDSIQGPWTRIATILQQDAEIATGAGHHSVIHNSNTDQYYMVYHRRPLGETDGNHRVTCIDEMHFDENGLIVPMTMTFKGVKADPLPQD
ncbi:glycoside hydrolase family 43 protein [Luteolibacter pohnpeiensis]|uniref:Glycoside hydrolase family 43 protein n=1 Tax=Luteolibacter pohnpeiensis TaxID=454153 RepID=A0A934SAR6_9BACT|nr:glycoside hydrolase family 43 protein [Luteolibacter pohnpeiensis]MBK1881898.1 glycoside hydrolase family 43 protein [Luteolibacter pohnpeiensis]